MLCCPVVLIAILATAFTPASFSRSQPFLRSTQVLGKTTPAQVKKVKLVKFTLKNKRPATMQLVVADKLITLEPNAQIDVELPEGSDVFADDRTTIEVHVIRELSGNTVSFR